MNARPTLAAARWLASLARHDADAGLGAHLVFVFAHPDDETVGAGSQLPAMAEATFVCVTDGSPRALDDAHAAGHATREDYARARRGELFNALAGAGIPSPRLHLLGHVDQEASLALVHLTEQIATIVRQIRPAVVLTHSYEGGHPDHDATAFAVHTAARQLLREGIPAPTVVEFAGYHERDGHFHWGEFLPHPERPIVTRMLGPRDGRRKQRLLACHATQQRVLANVGLACERFREAPAYDFTIPPHEGALLYERFPWGMTGARFRQLAAEAQREIEVAEPLLTHAR